MGYEQKQLWVFFYYPDNTGDVYAVETVLTNAGLCAIWHGKKVRVKPYKPNQNSEQWAFECKKALNTKNLFMRLYDTRTEAMAALDDLIKRGAAKEKGLDPDTQPNLNSTPKHTAVDCSRAITSIQTNLTGVHHE